MDHNHHHPSSSTTTKEEKDLSYDVKPASTNASSSSTAAIHDHNVNTLPLPQPPPLHLYSLPDVVHDAIAAYLTMKDMHCMMESSAWLVKAYGGKIKEVGLVWWPARVVGAHPTRAQLLLSLISHRPCLTRLALHMDETMSVVVEAMRKGYCDNLQLLKMMDPRHPKSKPELFQALCNALADGVCPKINALVLPDLGDLLPSMGKALQSSMGQGACGLKSLKMASQSVSTRPLSLSPLLSSGACEALEELKLQRLEAKKDLSEWLSRTKAAHLRAFKCVWMDRDDTDVAQALCSPGVAPILQILELDIKDAAFLPILSQAIGGGLWPHLNQIKVKACKMEMQERIPSLVEAMGVGAKELTTLKLFGIGVGTQGGVAVARMLRGGGCPRLEELDLRGSKMDDGGVVELARALEGGAPCHTTLRGLNLQDCAITSVGVRRLMESMGRGALPHLECLSLSLNHHIDDDGVVALAGAVSGGSLQSLQELGLYYVGMYQRGASALFQALRDHKPCPHLKKLDISANRIGDDGVVHLAEAIEAGALQHLQMLHLGRVGMGEEGFKSLVKAIVAQEPNPGCPRLEELNVCGNEGIGDGGVMYLAEMMKVEGAMQQLRVIDLNEVGMSEKGESALFQSLRESGKCPSLERVKLWSMKDTAKRDEVNATRGRVCQIRWL